MRVVRSVRVLRMVCVVRFAQAGYPRLRRGGRALGSTPNGRLNPAWTAGFRGRPVKARPRAARGSLPAPSSHAAMPSTARFVVSPSTRPPHRRDVAGGWDKTFSPPF